MLDSYVMSDFILPSGWKTIPLCHLVVCLDGMRIPLSAEERGKRQGDIPYWGANNIVDYIDDWIFDEPLVLLGEDGAPFFDQNKDVAFYIEGKIWVNNHTHVLRCNDRTVPKFLCYALNVVDYSIFIGGSTRDKLTQQSMDGIPIRLPTLNEQEFIYEFLDHITSNIATVLSEKWKLVELIGECKGAAIQQAVTRGLDPDVPLKPFGVEWLGDIPEHWEASQVKRHYSIQLGKMLQNTASGPLDTEVPYLKAQHVQWFEVDTDDPPTMWASPRDIVQYGICSGDLLVCEGGEGGRGGLVKDISSGHIIQNALHRVRPLSDSKNEYLQYVMSAIASTGWFEAINNKATIAHFTAEKFGALVIPIPPPSEQAAIVAHLDKLTSDIDAAIAHTRREIELLEEYRTRLIADVVTGKLDVREVSSNLPDVNLDDLQPLAEEGEACD